MTTDKPKDSDMVYKEFNRKWKTISRIIFGDEVGELSDFKKWLIGKNRTAFEYNSSASDRKVRFILPYSDSTRVASLEEINFNKKFEPLNIDEIKDIDELVEAVKERIIYAGNTYLGESKNLSESTDVVSSSYVYGSCQVSYSKWIAYCYNLEYCDNLFGCQNIGTGSSYSIRTIAADTMVRCLEVYSSTTCQDCYYSISMVNCKNCMFCFGLRNASYRIGNLQLTPEAYSKIKKKLLEEIIDLLKRKKSLPQLEDLFISLKPDLSMAKKIAKRSVTPEKYDKHIIENAFKTTTKIIFGKEIFGLDRYGPWLKEHIRNQKICSSVLSGEKMIVPDYANCYNYPENRLVTQQEILAIGESLAIVKEKIDDFSFKNAGESVNPIAFFNSTENSGVLRNNIESEINIASQNFYKSTLNLQSKYGAYNFYVLESEHVFGCHSLRKSTFSIRCYLSANLTRCFEVDSSRSCSDCYFCHNCENVRESMFCFNAKNLTCAIGNVELPKEKYLEIKKIILEEISKTLERNGKLERSIFDLNRKG